MNFRVFSRRSVKSYWAIVACLALFTSVATLVVDPQLACACADPDPGTEEYARAQAVVEQEKAQRPTVAAYRFAGVLAGGAGYFGMLTVAGLALRNKFGPFD